MINNKKTFVGENLTFARNAKSLTVKDLAMIINVERQAIYNYEKSLRVPESEILSKLSSALDKPSLYFFKSLDKSFYLDESELFFRKFNKQTEVDRQSSEVIGRRYFTQTIGYLYKYFDLPRQTKIFHAPNNFTSDEEIENISIEARKYFGIGNNPISNLQVLLENNLFYISQTNMISPKLNAFSFIGNKNCFILVNSDKNKHNPRYRFTLAHELGHLIMHSSIVDKDYLKENLKIIERQADYFAAAFLMPRDTFLKDVFDISINGLLALKQKWKVSIQAMIYRLYNLGIIDEDKKTYLFKEISRKGMRIVEPFDESIEKENPTFIKKAFTKIAEKVGYDTILNDLLLGKDMICALTGLEQKNFTHNSNDKVVYLDNFRKDILSNGKNDD